MKAVTALHTLRISDQHWEQARQIAELTSLSADMAPTPSRVLTTILNAGLAEKLAELQEKTTAKK